MLHHKKQPETWGCIYYSLYALTGEESLLQHAHDLSEPRALLQLHQLGYALLPIHISRLFPVYAPSSIWDRLLEQAGPNTFLLSVTVDGIKPGTRHAVALELGAGKVEVSDSALPNGPITYIPEQFKLSRYAQALEVSVLMTAELSHHPEVNASEVIQRLEHKQQLAREAREAAYII